MEKGYKILKKNLKSAYTKYISLYHHDPDFKPRCFRVIDMICIVKYSTINKSGHDQIFNLYEKVCSYLNEMRNIEVLYQIIRDIERTVILSLISTLDMIEDEAAEVYSKAEDEIRGSHDKFRLTSVALFYYTAPPIEKGQFIKTDFKAIWKEKLQPIFSNIIGLDNGYIKQYSKLILCEKESIDGQNKTFPENPFIIAENIFQLFDSIFMNSRNFKFISKASKIYKTFSNYKTLKKFQEVSLVQVINTKIPFNLEVNNQPKISDFEITPKGINIDLKCREDGMILFGKHELADVQLIESDFPICDICFAIFFKDGQYLMLDCAKYNYTSIKMDINQEYPVDSGAIINMANQGLMHIFDIDAKVYEKEVISVIEKQGSSEITKNSNIQKSKDEPYYKGILFQNPDSKNLDIRDLKKHKQKFLEFQFYYEYLSGPLSHCIDESSRKKKAKNNIDKNIIVFGRGGAGKEVDIYMNLNYYTSGRHISFRYDIEQGRLLAEDLESKHGSFILLKKKQEDSNKQWSKIYPLFIRSETFLSVCDYVFFFKY